MYRKNLIKAHLRIKCKVKQTLHCGQMILEVVKEERSCYIRNMTIKNNLHLVLACLCMLMHIYIQGCS